MAEVIRLGIDTSTALVQVAVVNGQQTLSEFDSATKAGAKSLKHGEDLAPAIKACLAEADLSMADIAQIAVGVGPGPFTGLRVGLVTARTLAMALDIEAVGVCSLDVIAADVDRPTFFVATDARRREIYLAHYKDHLRTDGPKVLRPELIPGPTAGEGAVLYPDTFPTPIGPTHPSAATLCRIVDAGSAEQLAPEPLYLRRPDAMAPRPPKRVS